MKLKELKSEILEDTKMRHILKLMTLQLLLGKMMLVNQRF